MAALTPRKVINSASVGSLSLNVYVSQANQPSSAFRATSDVEWLSLNNNLTVSGNVATITGSATANDTGAARTANVTIVWTDPTGVVHTEKIEVLQSPTANYLDVYPDTVRMQSIGEEITLSILANTTNFVARSSSPWLTAAITAGTNLLKLTGTANALSQQREAYVTIEATFTGAPKETKTIKVIQNAN